jgi:tRNA threonylcarbamoyl adenosine modification protein YeaZ
MSVILAIETSSHFYSAAILKDGAVVFEREADPSCRNAIEVAGACLAETGIASSAVDAVAVDIGPGNLSSVRAGLAFACGFAMGLNRPVIPISSLELLGREAMRQTGLPVLCARKGSRGRAFVGLVDACGVTVSKLGMIADIAAPMVEGITRFAVAGVFNDVLKTQFAICDVVDVGLTIPYAQFFALIENPIGRGVDVEKQPIVPISDFDEGV